MTHSHRVLYIRHMRPHFLGYNIHALFHANSLAVSFFFRNKAECCYLVTPRYSTPICSVLNYSFSSAPMSLIIQSVSVLTLSGQAYLSYVIQTREMIKRNTITDCDQHEMAPGLAPTRHSLTSPCCIRPCRQRKFELLIKM